MSGIRASRGGRSGRFSHAYGGTRTNNRITISAGRIRFRRKSETRGRPNVVKEREKKKKTRARTRARAHGRKEKFQRSSCEEMIEIGDFVSWGFPNARIPRSKVSATSITHEIHGDASSAARETVLTDPSTGGGGGSYPKVTFSVCKRVVRKFLGTRSPIVPRTWNAVLSRGNTRPSTVACRAHVADFRQSSTAEMASPMRRCNVSKTGKRSIVDRARGDLSDR